MLLRGHQRPLMVYLFLEATLVMLGTFPMKIFGGGDYNTNVLKYFNEHPNSGLELYNGPTGNLILIKRTGLGVQQYDGYGAFFNSVGFDKYASKMYWRRY